MTRLKLILPALAVALAALAIACSSETAAPEQPQAPAAAAPAAPAAAAPAASMAQPQAPAQPAPAAPAEAPPGAPAAPEPIIPSTAPTSRMVPVSDADSNIFSDGRFGGKLVWVPQGTVPNLDSMTSGTAIGRGVSWHFWESLAQWDAQGFIQPDMADSWEVDGSTYTFTLRDDLTWHDGSQVLPEDVEASITRFLAWDKSFAPVLNDIWVGFETVDDKTFNIELSEPSALLMTALGYVGGTQPNIMPKETAESVPPGELVQTFIASGPYKFVSWDPGNEIILDRYEEYVPRRETPSYRAGAKLAYFDRLDMKEIPDQQTRVSAVLTGTVDYLDVVSSDFYEEALDNSDRVSVHIGIPGAQPDIGFNTRDPLMGFDESGRALRQAIQAAVNAEEIMKGYGDDRLWQLCPSLQMCGTPWAEHTDNEELYNQDNPEKAKQLLEAAGYDGEPIIILDPTDFPTIHPIAPVLKEQLAAVGINAQIKATDWAGQIATFRQVDGWHIFTNWNSSNLYHPLVATHYRVGETTYPEDSETGMLMTELKTRFAKAGSLDEQFAITREIADVAWADPRRVTFGQFFQLRIYDKDIMDVEVRGAPVGSPLFLNMWWGDAERRAEDPR